MRGKRSRFPRVKNILFSILKYLETKRGTSLFENQLAWLELHNTTIDLLKWLIILLIAWFSGFIKLIYKYTKKPKSVIIPSASIIYFESILEKDNIKNAVRCSYILNVKVTNLSKEKIFVDHFHISYKNYSLKRSMKQKLLRIPFPNRPRKILGDIEKLLSVFFTNYPVEKYDMVPANGILETNESQGGIYYL